MKQPSGHLFGVMVCSCILSQLVGFNIPTAIFLKYMNMPKVLLFTSLILKEKLPVENFLIAVTEKKDVGSLKTRLQFIRW